MNGAVIALAVEALKLATTYGIPAAVQFIEALNKPEPSIDDILQGLQRAHKSAEDYLREARAGYTYEA